MYNVAIVGYGYWGPNIVRNFVAHPKCDVRYICDLDESARQRARSQFSDIDVIADKEIAYGDSEIDIFAIVTPVSTHFTLAKKALELGKHVFIEKPMTTSVAESNILMDIAKEKNLIGVVDHTFLFTGAVREIKSIIDSGEIGDINYFDSVRVNLGLFQNDVDVIWDLAPHDLAILFHITNEKPVSVTANGVDHLGNGLIDIAYLTLNYEEKMIANFHLNWLSPIKVRKILIGGTKKMIVYDDMEPSEKIKIYDKGVDAIEREEIHKLLVKYRIGDMVAPNISQTEALELEIDNFVEQIQSSNREAINDLSEGRRIVQILEASAVSLEKTETVQLS